MPEAYRKNLIRQMAQHAHSLFVASSFASQMSLFDLQNLHVMPAKEKLQSALNFALQRTEEESNLGSK